MENKQLHVLDEVENSGDHLPIDDPVDGCTNKRNNIGGGPSICGNMKLSWILLKKNKCKYFVYGKYARTYS